MYTRATHATHHQVSATRHVLQPVSDVGGERGSNCRKPGRPVSLILHLQQNLSTVPRLGCLRGFLSRQNLFNKAVIKLKSNPEFLPRNFPPPLPRNTTKVQTTELYRRPQHQLQTQIANQINKNGWCCRTHLSHPRHPPLCASSPSAPLELPPQVTN